MKYILTLLSALIFTNSYSQVSINELFITNASYELDLTTYNYLNWIELYNDGSSSQSLTGYYFSLKSEPSVHYPISGSINAKGYLRKFLTDDYTGSNYIRISANTDGDTIMLYNSSGVEINDFKFRKQYFNISCGRTTDGGTAIGYFTKPSPGASNSNYIPYPQSTGEPKFSIPGGFYSRTLKVNLTSDNNFASIYYTLDGSEPTEASARVKGPIDITKTSVLRAKAFYTNFLPSEIISQTYFINEHYTGLPVISVITDPKNLFDDMMGIYVIGKNGVGGYCSGNTPKNFNRPWERPANFEYFDKSKQQVIDQNVGISIGGSCLRLNDQKSLNIRPKGKYGKKKLNYSFFERREANSYNTVIVRNNGNDYNYALFREGFVQTLAIGQMNIDYSSFQPSVVYINGKYWGIQDFREKTDNNNITINYNLDESEIDVLERDAIVLVGSNASYKSLLSFINSHNMSVQSDYDYVASQIDIDEFIDYTIIEIFVGNDDWPGNNIKYWRKRDKSNKWRWIMSDMDRGYGLYDTQPDVNSLKSVIENPSLILGKLLKNSGFKNQFIERFYTHMNTTFSTNRVLNVVDSIQNLMRTEMPYHCTRWGYNMTSWNNEINKINQYAHTRQSYMSLYLQQYFNLPQDVTLNSRVAAPGMGNIYLNDVLLNADSSDGAFYDGFVYKLKAQPKPGYKFVKMIKAIGVDKIMLIPSNSEWFYNDSGTDLGKGWTDNDTSTLLWAKGKAQLGFGDGDEATVISYGSDSKNKYPTTYFKKLFYVDSAKKVTNAKLNLTYDDGAVVYLNGAEIARVNMPADSITYTTLASSSLENAVMQIALDASKIMDGENTIAVEIHQASVASSDLSFKLDLTALTESEKLSDTIYTSEITDTLTSSTKYTAYFELVVPKINLVINEVSPNNSSIADEFFESDDWAELYNPNDSAINLSGLYFSDSISNLGKYKFPETNDEMAIIAPFSYKVLWLDGQPEQGLLHLGFKLSKKGDEFVVSQSMGNGTSVIDVVRFGDVPQNNSVGRMPNITGLAIKLETPSPGKENIDNVINYDSVYIYNNIESLASMNLKVLYMGSDNRYKIIVPNNLNNGTIRVFDIMGRQRLTLNSKGNNEMILDLSTYTPGIYIVTLSTSAKNFSSKLIVW